MCTQEQGFQTTFITCQKAHLAQVLGYVDNAMGGMITARFQATLQRITAASEHFPQMLFWGMGEDTRPIWLPALQTGFVQVFEVDLLGKLATKLRALRTQQRSIPSWTHHIPLSSKPKLQYTTESQKITIRLLSAGFLPSVPTFVLLEGVAHELAEDSLCHLLAPANLLLGVGSKILFDCGSAPCVAQLNQVAYQYRGVTPLHSLPCPKQAESLTDRLQRLGYGQVQIAPVSRCSVSGNDDWFLVEATVK